MTIDTLNEIAVRDLCRHMKRFRDAFLWHLDQYQGPLVEIARETGVSRDTLNKLISREGSTTSAENAIRIAAFFGKTLEEFIRCDDAPLDRQIPALMDLLNQEERRLVEAMIRGVLSERESK